MFEPEFIAKHPTLVFVFQAIMILASLAFLWFLGRMGDNINKIRKMLEEEIRRRHES